MNYDTPANVIDEYWGVGVENNASLPSLALGGVTAPHDIEFRAGYSFPDITGTRTIGRLAYSINPPAAPGLPGYSFFVTSNVVFTANNIVRVMMQMVFVQTNLLDNPTVRVFFLGRTNSNNYFINDTVVEFSTTDIDPITGQPVTKYLYFFDDTPTFTRPNLNALPGTVNLIEHITRPGLFRPQSHLVRRSDFAFLPAGFETPAQTFDPNLVFTFVGPVNGRYQTNLVDITYAASQFTFAPRDMDGGGFGLLSEGDNQLFNPTNSTGRVEIEADQLNLAAANVRADNLISIKANTADFTGARLDAQNINIELYGTNGTATISNALSSSVSRMNGTMTAWSGVWQVGQFVTNAIGIPGLPQYGGTNTVEYTYHMLVINADATPTTFGFFPNHQFVTNMRTNKEVGVENLIAHSTNLVLGDDLTIKKTFLFTGESLLVPTNGVLNFTNENVDIGVANFPNLKYFTNQGFINIPQIGNFGFDRAQPYSNIVNEGTMIGQTLQFRADLFINTNSLSTIGGALVVAARTNLLSGGVITAGANVEMSGDDLVANGTFISSGGALNLNVVQRLTDLGVTNDWVVQNGFSLGTQPVKGDLLSTTITSFAPSNFNTIHLWAGENRGDSPNGYANNAALGRLILDGASGSRFLFAGAGSSNALYLDYLELRNNATNFATALSVSPSLTIYFADANFPPDKITNAHGGRFVWVSPTTRAGPIVSVPLSIGSFTNMTTQAYRALLPGNQDYDGDGIVNSEDETPLSGFTVNDISVVNLPPKTTFISWQAIANTTYFVEYKTSLGSGTWLPLGTFSSPDNRVLTVGDPVPLIGQRYYRVRYQRP
ncbi:MAG: hypothetical protein AB1705_15255 [Verrucomicrobiota bacterium]